MTRINIEDIKRIEEEKKSINKLNFEQIEFYEDGKKLEINPKILQDWQYTGFNNTDFVIMEFYKEGFKK